LGSTLKKIQPFDFVPLSPKSCYSTILTKASKYVKSFSRFLLKNFNEITLSRGDTLVVYWDFERYPLDMAQDFFNIIQKAFPENQVLFVPIEVNMGVIKDGESMGTF
jgi:hypothetical protein